MSVDRIKIDSWRIAAVLVGGLLLFHFLISCIGWHNPIAEEHGFRQTQTALVSYWLLRGSPFFAYETPVLGPPWALPMELPLYQAGAAYASKFSGIPLDQSGRLVSLFCYYASLGTVFWLMRRLRLPAACFVFFGVLYLTSPLYLFWSRAFLIESAAVALSLGYLAVCWVAMEGGGRPSLLWLAALLGSLAAGVKITTWAGALAAVCLLFVLSSLKARPKLREAARWAALAIDRKSVV